MQVIDHSSSTDGIFALAYGGSGTGKTHFVGTLGDLGYTLLIDADQGYKTLVSDKVPGITQKMRDNIVIVTFDSFGDLNTAYKLVMQNDPAEWSKFLTKQSGKPVEITRKFDWVVWDTWTEVQWFMMQQLRKNQQLLSPNMGKDIDFRQNVQIQHWGMLTDLNKLAIEQLRECSKTSGVNQLFLMQEKLDKNDTLGTVEKGPAIHGKLISELPAYFDIVLRMFTTPTGEFKATTQRKQGWPAKSRVGTGQEYSDPVAKKVFEL